MKNKYLLPMLFTAVLAVGLNGTAYAVPCTQGYVTGSTSCQDGLDNNDNLNPTLTVNDEGFFGFNDWVYLQKDEEGTVSTDIDFGLTVTPANSWPDNMGSWEFLTNLWNVYSDAMIVIKNGNNNGTFFSGYLIANNISSGTWDTGDKDISHLSLYARGSATSVPEPEAITLLIVGLIGFMLYGKKRKAN
jgi:hypothetical protein